MILELLFVWSLLFSTASSSGYSKDTYGWRLLAETTSCKTTAEQLGYKPAEYRCIKK